MLSLGMDVMTLGEAFALVSWWKPILAFPPILVWAWYVSAKLDKQAQRFLTGGELAGWNLGHLAVGLLGIAAFLLMPLPGILGFIVGWVTMVVLFAVDIVVFVAVTNKDERVPPAAKLSLLPEREDTGPKVKSGTVELTIRQPSGNTLVAPPKDTPEYELRLTAEAVLIEARDRRASELEIRPTSAGYAPVFLIDGVATAGDAMPPEQAVALIDFWKGACELDVADRRRRQTTTIKISRTIPGGTDETKATFVTLGSKAGQKLTVVFDRAEAVRMELDTLGFLEPQLKVVRGFGETHEGVVLVAAPPNHGGTTTTYSLLSLHDAYTLNLQTLEFEIEAEIEGIAQTVYDPNAEEATFATSVRSQLRRDPDVLSLPTVPDPDTLKEVSLVDDERTRVYATLNTESAVAAVQAFVKASGDANRASSVLRGAIGQRLMRRLCKNCRVPYQPSPDAVKKLGVPADKVTQLYRAGGQVMIKNKPETCPVCNGVGYIGQVGAFEAFAITPDARAAVRDSNWKGLTAAIRKQGAPTMQQAAIALAIRGETSLEEVSRVTTPAKPKKKRPAAQAKPAGAGQEAGQEAGQKA